LSPSTYSHERGAARQEHDGAVLDGTWAASGDVFITGGSYGRVKVWTVTPFRCTWTSEGHLTGGEIDLITKVAEDLANGFIAAASRSGDIIILSGFDTHPDMNRYLLFVDNTGGPNDELSSTSQFPRQAQPGPGFSHWRQHAHHAHAHLFTMQQHEDMDGH